MSNGDLLHVRRSRVRVLAIAAFVVAACGSGGSATPSPTPASTDTATAASPSATATATASMVSASAAEVSPMADPSPSTAKLSLTSSAFADGRSIPSKYSCRGEDVSPPLTWSGIPADAKALVLFVDDPDGRDWVHWSVLDLPAKDGHLPEGVHPDASPPQQGTNDFRKVGYGGPCPPSGTHHYRFTLYVLAKPLDLSGHPDGDAVRRALDAADVVGRVRLTGTFKA